MTFKECTENFPIGTTLVGWYSTDQSFTLTTADNVNNIHEWRDNPFWEDSSCYSFVVFLPLIRKFECWSFCFSRVSGYLNETYDMDEFYPATYSEDFGWEKIDPFTNNAAQVIVPDDELAIELGWPLEDYRKDKWRREQVAYLFNPEAYQSGYVFTSADAVKKFVREQQNLL